MKRYKTLETILLLTFVPILCFGFKPGPNRDKIPKYNQRIAVLDEDGIVRYRPTWSEYIKRVVIGEMGLAYKPEDKDKRKLKEAYKAQAVASRCYAIAVGFEINGKREGKPAIKGYGENGGDQQYYTGTLNDKYFKEFIIPAVEETGDTKEKEGEVLTCYNRNYPDRKEEKKIEIIHGFFAKDWENRSSTCLKELEYTYPNGKKEKGYNHYIGDWTYPPYLQSRLNNGRYSPKVKQPWYKRGLAQDGAKRKAEAGWDYEKILRYYYAIEPPYIRQVELWVNDTKPDYKYLPNTSKFPDAKKYYYAHRVYCGKWEDTTDYVSRQFTNEKGKYEFAYGKVKVLIFGSESIDPRKKILVYIEPLGKQVYGKWREDKFNASRERTRFPIWLGEFDSTQIPDGEYTLKIDGGPPLKVSASILHF